MHESWSYLVYWRGQSYATVRKNARQLVALASRARATNKRELVAELSRIGMSGADIDDEELRYLLDQVNGPRAKGPEQAQPDAVWEWAKVGLLTVYAGYQQLQPQFAADPQIGDRFPRQTITTLCESACYYLFTLLGVTHQQVTPPDVPR